MRTNARLIPQRKNNLAEALAKVMVNFNGGESEHPIVVLTSNDEDVTMLLDKCTTNEFLNLVLQVLHSIIDETETEEDAEHRMSVIKDLFDKGFAEVVKAVREGY